MTEPREMRTTASAPVPIPWARRLRYWRTRVLPVAVWLAAVAAAGVVAERQMSAHAPLRAMVEVREALVSPSLDGVLASLDVTLHQSVEKGAIVARMDNRLVVAELMTVQAELAQQRSEIASQREQLLWTEEHRVGGRFFDVKRAALSQEEARVDVLDREAELQIAQVELDGLESLLARRQVLVDEGVLDVTTYEETLYATRAAEARVTETTRALEAARTLYDDATRFRQDMEAAMETRALNVDDWLAPLVDGIAVIEARLHEIDRRLELLTLRAPLSGRVTALTAHTGQTVLAGLPVLTITNDVAERVIVYVDEAQMKRVQVGTELEILSRHPGGERFRARVASVSAKVEELPVQLWPSPMFPQWGLPLVVEDLPEVDLRPGEVLAARVVMAP